LGVACPDGRRQPRMDDWAGLGRRRARSMAHWLEDVEILGCPRRVFSWLDPLVADFRAGMLTIRIAYSLGWPRSHTHACLKSRLPPWSQRDGNGEFTKAIRH
jgi:hypothetical protein